MSKRISFLLLFILSGISLVNAENLPDTLSDVKTSQGKTEIKKSPTTVHPPLGTSFSKNGFSIKLITRKQNYSWRGRKTLDTNIYSPKSVNFHPKENKFYVNSLEGGTTIVYDGDTRNLIKVIHHRFSKGSESLWAEPSGLYTFRHPRKDSLYFTGKPVESTFSHSGRYLWVPYYRRSFDLNAQEPSAVAVIDTRNDTIIKLFETGPLPKMVSTSADGTSVAITHWGDNTVGVIDISSADPGQWHYSGCYTVEYKLDLDFPLNKRVNRDSKSGYCLRGTVFTPDNRFLLIGCMGKNGGIAVIDLENGKYLGMVDGSMPNLRHLIIDHGYVYAAINNAGYIQKTPLAKFYECIYSLSGENKKNSCWQNCKVPSGVRTIVPSPDGKYIFATCNSSSCISIVNAESMTLVGTIPADSYPVGLDLSNDGRILISTSQGKNRTGGNAVDIYEIKYPEQ